MEINMEPEQYKFKMVLTESDGGEVLTIVQRSPNYIEAKQRLIEAWKRRFPGREIPWFRAEKCSDAAGLKEI